LEVLLFEMLVFNLRGT